ncbi:hypothetical protein [Pseudarthrobacter niigatensis]|uniref:Uncharacterized protein n=1 Tax=Pseudarthrobacter niigatensis TaxID=369935 RepID=A0AAJ1SRY3_9MICC|nr:hypothetical protein [Pseudarthrobacter niigatensis]MDQ0145509.1 hypothetical protein [Pseudarthrobacter niigatensis]MDQ0267824.1 hypothetical protein [Pseudarthrobacter niigatensis]
MTGATMDRGPMAGKNALAAADEYQDLLRECPGIPGFLLALGTSSASGLRTDASTLDGGELSAPPVGPRG